MLYKAKLEANQENLNHLVDTVLDSNAPEVDRIQLLNWVANLFPL